MGRPLATERVIVTLDDRTRVQAENRAADTREVQIRTAFGMKRTQLRAYG
jgi:hypothetical protein